MFILQTLSALALKPFLAGDDSLESVTSRGAAAALQFFGDRFSDQSRRLTRALHTASERAWRTLEIALAGESLWTRLTDRAEDKAFRQQIRAFLDAQPLGGLPARAAEFRNEALGQLRQARKADRLAGAAAEPRALVEQADHLARFKDPLKQVDLEWEAVGRIADELRRDGCGALAQLLALRTGKDDPPLLVLAVRYFFRRAVETDQALFQGLADARLQSIARTQTEGYDALYLALSANDLKLEEGLAALEDAIRKGLADLGHKVDAGIDRVHRDYLDLRAEQTLAATEMRRLHQDVLKALEQHRLERRELHAGDSLSLRGDAERQLVKQLMARYRALPEAERRNLPALLNGLGKLEVVTGDFDGAQRDFQQVAAMVSEPKARAEALYNGYRAALERRDHATALLKLRAAARDDPARFAPFPLDKYEPVRILGAGGFGVAFLCRHRYMAGQLVVKTLTRDDLDQGVEQVFAEARHLQQLNDPAIIRIQDCGFADPASGSRPYLVMDHFDGVTLEEHVGAHGPVRPEELIDLARLVARGLKAAHGKGILHRDVKPANLLVRRGSGVRPLWDVKIIDFGLALQRQTLSTVHNAGTPADSVVGRGIAGTIDYASPEQMGRLPGVDVGFPSDVYGFGKTCCYALFGTPQPTFEDYEKVGRPLAKLLSKCMDPQPKSRFPSFNLVLEQLDRLHSTDALPEVIPLEPRSKSKEAFPEVIPVAPRRPAPARAVPVSPAVPAQLIVPPPLPPTAPPPLPPARAEDEVIDLVLPADDPPSWWCSADQPKAERTPLNCTVTYRGHVVRAECSTGTAVVAVYHDGVAVAGGWLMTDGAYAFAADEGGEQANYEVLIHWPNKAKSGKPCFTIRRNGVVLYNDR